MQFREAARIVSHKTTAQPSGIITQGQKVTWEDTHNKLVFVPDHAYTTEGSLHITNKATGNTRAITKRGK